MRRLVSVAMASVMLGGLFAVAPAGPAYAGSCEFSAGYTTVSDYAWTNKESGTCTGVMARHRYDPIWSYNNYWTAWDYDGDFAISTPTEELFDSDHDYFNI